MSKTNPVKLTLALASLLGAGFVLWQGLAPVLGDPVASAAEVVESDPWADTDGEVPGSPAVMTDALPPATEATPTAAAHAPPDWEQLFRTLVEREELLAREAEPPVAVEPEPVVEAPIEPVEPVEPVDGPPPATQPEATPPEPTPTVAAPAPIDHHAAVSQLDLSGIASTAGGRRAALMQGRILHEGDTLPGLPYTVTHIEADRVLLSVTGVEGTFTLLLRPLRSQTGNESAPPATSPGSATGQATPTPAEPESLAETASSEAAAKLEALSGLAQALVGSTSN